jgi:hypothetical protein
MQSELTEAHLNTIGYVLSRYGALSGKDLIHLTHSEDPWLRANAIRQPGRSTRIREQWIKEYFETSGSSQDDEEVMPNPAEIRELLRGADERRTKPARSDSLEELLARRG